MAERKLLFSVTRKDLRIDTFRAGGNGGQNQNKRDTGVRITHPESGAVAESRTYRTQGENKRAALRRLIETPKWKAWHLRRVREELGLLADLEEQVERMMAPKNLRVEVRGEDGRWTPAEGLAADDQGDRDDRDRDRDDPDGIHAGVTPGAPG